jgi:hypothetical protein
MPEKPATKPAATRKAITGSVAALINERELVINRGAEHGVTSGMRFRVLTSNDVEVTDPETGESLGNIVRVKVRVEASQVRDKMTICRTYETIRSGIFSGIEGFANVTTYRTLKAGDEGFLPPISENDSYVKVGDPVEEITG